MLKKPTQQIVHPESLRENETKKTTKLVGNFQPPSFVPVTFLGGLSDPFRGEVTFIWVIKRPLGRSWLTEKYCGHIASFPQGSG